ncbi:SDR family oxidoreductase [Mycobacterium sp. E2497]|uniref:SDR family oxidoreductase n=1 Tax=Mycobacterium sp. E2497 TaxID=1834135 RepID=UPI0018D3337A|nr:SDR family oxidoreductase [Mycobacterium sp. E2497]
MPITSTTTEPGIVAVTVDFPPVNAIPSRGWFELADVITAAGHDPETHVVILRAEGRGFNAGVDIKEMQRTEGFTALIDAIVEKHGRLDVVVNNAGGSPYVLTAESSAKFNRKIIELNLLGALSVSQHANEKMQQQDRGGSIINICSLSGRRPSPGTGAYGAAKAGLESLTQTLAVEWGPKVRVNACVVGMVETEQSELFYGDAESIAAISKNVPLGRLAKPDDIGWAAAFLASAAASYISGASLEVHGGGEPPHYLATTNASAIK